MSIPGGYVIFSRKIIESEIFRKPPLYLKVWVYLLSRAQYKSYKKLERGQLVTNIPEIQEACSYYVGYRKMKPTKDQIYQILKWLRKSCEASNESYTNATMNNTTKSAMITTAKTKYGLLINIDNYCFYQNPKNYEHDNETNDESNNESNSEKVMKTTRTQQQPDTINKESIRKYKNDKEGKEEVPQLPPLLFPSDIYKTLYENFGEVSYRTWFMNAAITEQENDIVIAAHSEPASKILKNKYAKKIEIITGKKVSVKEVS